MTGLTDHLAGGATMLARAWAVTRRDGQVLGFTDHDRDLSFEGVTFRAATGMTASALQQTTGLSVDNAAALGALSDAGITEADIMSGRWDGAQLVVWLVNWADVAERVALFRGAFGEITRGDGAFEVELRGLAEALGAEQGLVFLRQCSAIHGDSRCRFDLETPGFFSELPLAEVAGPVLRFPTAALGSFVPGWFAFGTVTVLEGAGAGLTGVVKNDRLAGAWREVELWEPVRAGLLPGQRVRLQAGCDKRAETCKLKFDNFLNFRGFPDIPGEDWLTSYPLREGVNDGGSRRR